MCWTAEEVSVSLPLLKIAQTIDRVCASFSYICFDGVYNVHTSYLFFFWFVFSGAQDAAGLLLCVCLTRQKKCTSSTLSAMVKNKNVIKNTNQIENIVISDTSTISFLSMLTRRHAKFCILVFLYSGIFLSFPFCVFVICLCNLQYINCWWSRPCPTWSPCDSW